MWRNGQPRETQNLVVSKTVWVRVPSSPPIRGKIMKHLADCTQSLDAIQLIDSLKQQLAEQQELKQLLIKNPEFVRIFNLLLRRY